MTDAPFERVMPPALAFRPAEKDDGFDELDLKGIGWGWFRFGLLFVALMCISGSNRANGEGVDWGILGQCHRWIPVHPLLKGSRF